MYDYPLSYSGFRDEELLNLASRMHTYMPDAQRALSAELEIRGLNVPEAEPNDFFAFAPLSANVEMVRILP
ncbi:MAG TPA: hypothetical protein PLP17_02390 [Oligoflexia bacterium]|nr:hypothetical protein [Oligoflexia bacterium]